MVVSRRPHRRPSSRSGYLYISVLFVTLILMTIVTASLTQSTYRAESVGRQLDSSLARSVAESEIHAIIVAARALEDWSAGETQNTWSTWRTPAWATADEVHSAEVRHRWFDPDGDLSGPVADDLVLTVQVRIGDSRYALQTRCEPESRIPDVLAYSIHSTGEFNHKKDTLTQSDGYIAANNFKTGENSEFAVSSPKVRFVVGVDAGDEDRICGELEYGAVPPQPTEWITAFAAEATALDTTAIPKSGKEFLLDDNVLSRSSNPWGTKSDRGIYSLDAEGDTVVIQDMWIIGTLVIQNAKDVILREGNRLDYRGDTPMAVLLSDSDIDVENHVETISWKGLIPGQVSQINGAIICGGKFHFKSSTDGSPLQIQGMISAASFNIDESMIVESFPSWGSPIADEMKDRSVLRIKPQTFQAVAWEN